MRLHPLLLPTVALVTNLAAAKGSYGAYLWTIDADSTRQSAGQQVQSTTNEAAEGILLRRKSQPDSLFQHDINEDILSDMDAYSGYQLPVFGTGKERYPDKLLIRLSGYTQAVSALTTLPDLWIETPNHGLLEVFDSRIKQENICEYTISPSQRPDVRILYTYHKEEDTPCRPQREIEVSPTLLVAISGVPAADKLATSISAFYRQLLHLRATANVESTLLVLPPTKDLAATKPRKHVELRKRAEVPLDITYPQLDMTTMASNKTNMTLPKDVPECFSSMSSCQNTTNSCMGHGKCVKKSDSCYKCSCSRTVVRKGKEGESDKTILWGGNACQKKDVSAEFNLFAGVTIALITLAATGVGVLVRMGAQDLPSVIGAGVVGPRAQQ